jgi:hypothetical protein
MLKCLGCKSLQLAPEHLLDEETNELLNQRYEQYRKRKCELFSRDIFRDLIELTKNNRPEHLSLE